MMPVDWMALADQIDTLVNNAFGLDMEIIPWSEPETSGHPDPYKVGGSTDDIRGPARALIGVFVSRAAAEHQFPQMLTANVTADMYVSVKSSDIGDMKPKDRITIANLPHPWPAPFVGELSFVTPGDTGRSLLHLVQVK